MVISLSLATCGMECSFLPHFSHRLRDGFSHPAKLRMISVQVSYESRRRGDGIELDGIRKAVRGRCLGLVFHRIHFVEV